MSGRCKACNAVMSDEDLSRKFPPHEDGKRDYSDLCGECHMIAMDVFFDTYIEPVHYMDCEEFGVRGMLGIQTSRSYE